MLTNRCSGNFRATPKNSAELNRDQFPALQPSLPRVSPAQEPPQLDDSGNEDSPPCIRIDGFVLVYLSLEYFLSNERP